MSNKTNTNRSQSVTAVGDRANLDCQYRSIGISAVAAALPFAGKMKSSKNPAHPSARPEKNEGADGRRRSILSV